MRARPSAWLRRAYYRIGIHTAPPGTLFHLVHRQVRRVAYRRIARYASGELFARAAFGGTNYYDIWRIRRTRQVDGLALVFFLGLGDYLFATPLIEALRAAHPGLLLHAYVSSHADAVNAPLVESLLRNNRHIDAVFTYRGRPRRYWQDYNFDDALRRIPRNFVILPVVYSTHSTAYHRVTSLFEAFGLPVRLPVPVPLLEHHPLSAPAEAILAMIRARMAGGQWRAVAACHFGTRSSRYHYPHRDVLLRRLLAAGILPVVFSEAGRGEAEPAAGISAGSVAGVGAGSVAGVGAGSVAGVSRGIEGAGGGVGTVVDGRAGPGVAEDAVASIGAGPVRVDVAAITPSDTIGMLRTLSCEACPVYALTVNSVLWPITAGLDIPNLGLHIFFDPSMHQYVYPNTYVVTQHHYPMLSPGRVYTAPEQTWRQRQGEDGLALTDFEPDYVLDCFLDMLERSGLGGRSPGER